MDDLLRLQKASQRISSLLNLDQLIDRIVNEVACSFGLVEANVFLYEQERGELVHAGVRGCPVHGKGYCLRYGKEGMVGYVAATGQMRYAPDVRKDPYYISCGGSTLSEVAVPLLVEDRLIGVFTASHPDLNAFPPKQLKILQALCSHIAVAVQNARIFQQAQHEREQMTSEALEARSIQQALFPRSSPYIPGFAVCGLCIPAGAVGGDWYDFIPLKDGLWGLVLADVSGKGTAAALLMSAARGILRSLAGNGCTPSDLLRRLNRMLVEDFPPARYVTMVYAILDPANRRLTFANAGHLQPLLIRGQEARFLSTDVGMPLGLGPGDFSEVEVEFTPGSRLVFYSDGITEAANPEEEEYGQRRLQEHLLQPEASSESLLADVRSFVNGYGLHDDATVIAIRMLG
ncbi:GAF domain-containing SpoIIE family protein phosphatase [Edaphobacter bradus]|uniref:GAF domain-containing SpoIIE family protein phosphatase n=1 Tax=Edaphobacter bradus TaxID=2259016 RepID=UPI0021E03EDE|nr:GAF domain-containing SpoIIE family protein phosphatase [Edaphobacter bradus]